MLLSCENTLDPVFRSRTYLAVIGPRTSPTGTEYNLESAIERGIEWAGERIKEKRGYLDRLYPWK